MAVSEGPSIKKEKCSKFSGSVSKVTETAISKRCNSAETWERVGGKILVVAVIKDEENLASRR